MKFSVMVALDRLNQLYDGLAAYISLCQDMELGTPHYVKEKTQALIAHDRILTDMVTPTGRTGEIEYQRQLAQVRADKVRAFFNARNPYK